MAKKTEPKTAEKKLEREYIIPLKEHWKRVPRYKRANRAIKTIKEFIVRHFKLRDRDLKKVKIDMYLNEEVWFRGIKKPPTKIKVRAVRDGTIIRVTLVDYSDKAKFKKLREEKAVKAAEEKKSKKKQEVVPEKPREEKTEEQKKEEKEKQASVAEAGKQMEKAAAKELKHQAGRKAKEPKRQVRKALEK